MGTGVGEAALYAVAAGVASAAVSSILAPKPKDITPPKIEPPKIEPVLEQPDPLAQKDATRKKLIEKMQRSGRASTIMTDNTGKLGG